MGRSVVIKNYGYVVVSIALCVIMAKDVSVFAQSQPVVSPSDLSVYVDIHEHTWKSRGRIFYDIKGSLFRKLTAAGFTVVRNEQEPHVYTLSVRYIEEKGAPYAVTKYGTVLRANFSLFRDSAKPLWSLRISEFSENSVTGTPPYLDVLQKFDTNPSFFFMGGLLRIFLEKNLLTEQALPVLLQQVAFTRSMSVENSQRTDRFHESDHSMEGPHELYLPTAILRSIQELVRCEGRQAIPTLTRFLKDPHEEVRAGASKALSVLEAL